MKKLCLNISSILLLIFLSSNIFCQNANPFKERSAPSDGGLGPLLLMDGFPILSMDELNKIDPQTITTIYVKKDTLYDCRGKATYYGLITVTTKDSYNTGLKYILKKTENWISSHPLAEYKLNGK